MTQSSSEQEVSLSPLDYPFDCTGNVVAGDTIIFTESVFGGSYGKPEFLGERTIAAKVLKESFGEAKQQHTVTLKVLASNGTDPPAPGRKILRKGAKHLPLSHLPDGVGRRGGARHRPGIQACSW